MIVFLIIIYLNQPSGKLYIVRGERNMDEKTISGYWAIATQKHLKNFRNDSANMDEFDSLNVSGKAGRFIGMIRGNKEITNMRK